MKRDAIKDRNSAGEVATIVVVGCSSSHECCLKAQYGHRRACVKGILSELYTPIKIPLFFVYLQFR
jgi:hypothetical protein